MRIIIISVLAILALCINTEGHYIPFGHHWGSSFGHHMHHDVFAHQNSKHFRPSIQRHPSTFQGNLPSSPVFQVAQAPNSRPAFPAPGSITGERADQSIDILTGLLQIRSGLPGFGLLTLLGAF